MIKKVLFVLCVALCLSGYVSSPVALILGFVFTLVFGDVFEKIRQLGIQHLLKISIVGLGFGMFFMETLKTGREGLLLTFLSIVATLSLGWLLTRLLNIDLKLGHLISSGTSICGGSAIAAVAPVIQAKPKIISVALGVVFLLNSIALFIFPSIGEFFALTQEQFGLWAAIAIHDTSSVVGAALTFGDEALRVATTVKLARTLWIIPVSILSMFMFKSKDGKIKIPWFILYFVIAILMNSYLPLPELLTGTITTISKRLLIVTLFLVGTTLSVKQIKETGFKPFALGIILWVFISIGSLTFIMNT
ncbi:putative sulfate exporter family transporter [Bizionia argentinensis JUB59]|uniref:Putative sulfate exporter family transporter n=1 Tax=Bizionia argentinensis JUB59 TaxID=1046627 RepID=G2EHM2_9FLAO|nr:putative sulfate exporter family transporter [Bizionia argentinensis]EGV42059.1 putative sulfate exporter family transporter [Bizionia argentinensis JUB59]